MVEIEMSNEIPRPERMKYVKSLIDRCAPILRDADFKTMEHQYKGNNPTDLVTHYDRKIEDLLVEGIAREYPQDGFVSEEMNRGEVSPDSHVWMIDPIDGTTNFVHKHHGFSICVACYAGLEPLFALVFDVMEDRLFEAVVGEGAWLNGKPLPSLDKNRTLGESLADFSVNGIRTMRDRFEVDMLKLAGKIRGHRAYGSASLILCQIAAGEMDIYISPKLYGWDFAAGGIIMAELGGELEVYPPMEHPEDGRTAHLVIATANGVIKSELYDLLELNRKLIG